MSDRKTVSSFCLATFVLGWTSTAVLAQEQWSPDPNANNPVAVVADVQSFPLVVGFLLGSVFAWRNARFDVGTGTTVYDIDAQRFDQYGVPQWGSTGVRVVSGSVSATGSLIARPFTMSSDLDGVILAWHDVRNVLDTGDIYAQKLNSFGIPQWIVGGMPVTTAFGLQDSPVAVTDGSGGAIVAWQDQRAGPANSDIYAQRLNASGLPQWVASGVPVAAAPGNQLQPAVAQVFSGVAITWVDSRSGDQDIYAQELTLAGGPQWMLDGVAVSAVSGNQRRPVISTSGFGFPTVAWEDARNGAADIFAQGISPAGVALWTPDGVPISSAPNRQGRLSILSVLYPVDGAVLVWEDDRNAATTTDIYAADVSRTGVLPITLQSISID